MKTQAAPAAAGAAADGQDLAVPAQDLARHNGPLADQLQAAARRVLRSGQYILGGSVASEVRAFEDELAAAVGAAHAVGCSSGTDALLAMLMAAGVGPGDEVVTTPFSFVAAAESIARLGARPRFADIETDTLNLDPGAACAAIGPRTKAVLTVHLFGRAANCPPLLAACGSQGIPLLEDAAQAMGAVDGAGRPVGTIGLAGALSFFPSKNLGGFGDGGMVITNDGPFAQSIRLLRSHGAAAKFHHIALGGNFRLDELQAALLRVKLPHLSAWTGARRRLAEWYGRALATSPLTLPAPDPGCVWNQYVVRVPGGRRDQLAAHLKANQIGAAVYYPEPLHLQPCFAAFGHRRGEFPAAEQAASDVLALPIYPEMTETQVYRVGGAVRQFFGQPPGDG